MAAPSTRVGELEIRGLSDGILKTSLDLVLGVDRAQAEQLVGGSQDGSLFIPVSTHRSATLKFSSGIDCLQVMGRGIDARLERFALDHHSTCIRVMITSSWHPFTDTQMAPKVIRFCVLAPEQDGQKEIAIVAAEQRKVAGRR